ncbi:RDD family protein [Bacteriovoracaceae bacterium]|nr:RDD family protein [Bacteriovoracaceae bacterium]
MDQETPDYKEELENLSEEGLDDFESMLKPLSKGLGFHHAEKTSNFKKDASATVSLSQKGKMLKRDFEEARKEQPEIKTSNLKNNEKESLNMGELSPFYHKKKNESSINRVENKLKPKSEKRFIEDEVKQDIKQEVIGQEANIFLRFVAYIIDLVAIAFLVGSSIALITLSAQIPFSEIRLFLGREFAISFAPIFFLFYIFYFMLLEKTSFSTLGKRVFSLQVVGEKNTILTLGTTFLRCFISLSSIITLGLPVFLSWQDKLTSTRVIKK